MMAQEKAAGTESGESINLDPYGARPGQLHAIAVMASLAARTDLPVVKWQLEPNPEYRGGDSYEWERFPTARGHIWSQGDRALDALNMWAQAFGVEITEEPHRGQIHACARFAVDEVPVEIVTVYEPDGPGTEV